MALRNPNGYGSVVKLSGRRRNPYMVRKTVDYDDRAYPIYAVIGYYPTRKDAMLALAQYNAKPYDIELAKSTFAEIYEAWSKLSFPQMGKSLVSSHKAAYGHCSALYEKPYKSIRKYDFQTVINGCTRAYSTRNNIRNLFVQLDKFAFDNDIIDKCYSSNLTIGEREPTATRTVFTDEEVRTLWQHRGDPCVDATLFMLYTGMRCTEMLTLTADMVDLDARLIRHGIKTAAGKDRVIPIHDDIFQLVRDRCKGSYLFADGIWSRVDDPKGKYASFTKQWKLALSALNMTHNTHECRHTFRSKLDSAEANKVCIDLIMGHKTADIGERVYTHKTIEELKNAISKLSYGVRISSC